MKAILAVLLIGFALILAGCTGSSNTNSNPGTINPAPAGTQEISVSAQKFSFTPGAITVKKGTHVRLTFTSTDTTHGLSLSEFGVNVMADPGQSKVVEFDANQVGTFTFRCSVPCGSGHQSMTGTLVVTE